MMRFRYFILFVLAFTLSLNLCSQESPAPDESKPCYYLYVWLEDGHYDTYALKDKPKITYADGNLVVNSQWGTMLYAHEQVWKMTLLDSETPLPTIYLLVWLEDGHYDTYAFKDKPKITYADGNLVVNSQWGTMLYAHEQVWKITLHDSDTPLPTMLPSWPSLPQQKEQLSRRGDVLFMKGLKPNSELFIYGSDGRLYGVHTASAEGELRLDLADGVPAGTYLLKTETITFKIIKK